MARRARERAGLIREMSDESAYMALALNNERGELPPLEVGVHALGSGLTQEQYG